MKKLLLFLIISFCASIAFAQSPVSWAFSAKKLSDKTYEVHLTATMQTGWHLYSQVQPDDAVVNPTAFKFTGNPLITLNGKPAEKGTMEKFHDEKLGISANQYKESVDFVQVIKLKGNVKTNLSGLVEFQTCDDKKCLPPKKVNFDIALK